MYGYNVYETLYDRNEIILDDDYYEGVTSSLEPHAFIKKWMDDARDRAHREKLCGGRHLHEYVAIEFYWNLDSESDGSEVESWYEEVRYDEL